MGPASDAIFGPSADGHELMVKISCFEIIGAQDYETLGAVIIHCTVNRYARSSLDKLVLLYLGVKMQDAKVITSL